MISTGMKYLDKLIGGLKLGDNVVWQISSGVPIEYFIKNFFTAPGRTIGSVIYINFNYSPHTICKRFDEIFKAMNFTLVDAFTHGKGNGDPVFLDFYDQKGDYDLSRVVCIGNPRDIPSFIATMNEIQTKNRENSFYIFDSLTGMNELWKDERAVLDFFGFTCPKLYDMNTLAYWIFEKDAHSKEFIAGLTHITQIVLSVSATNADYHELRINKLEDRPSLSIGGIHHFRIIDREIQFKESKPEDIFLIGNKVRELRKAFNITQAELAARLGMTPGAVSQIENDLITPSLSTLIHLSSVFKKPVEHFINPEAMGNGKKGYAVFRKKDPKPSPSKNLQISQLTDEMGVPLRPFHVKIGAYQTVEGPILLHKGREILTVVSGTLNVTIDGEEVLFRKGDSLLIEKTFVEKWRNPGKSDCEFIYILF